MEHGIPSFHDDHETRSNSDSNQQHSTKNGVGSQVVFGDANMVRIMQKVLPSEATVSEETKQMMEKCVSKFISIITSEANKICHKEHRKIVTVEDMLCAMHSLGFDNYVEPLTIFLKRYRSEVENLRNDDCVHNGKAMSNIDPSN
ncbi:hypothetical protein VNO78_30757 [Psophocarpus tetragonolobus]|uniref:Transcription factor CBF/NF-Y/archaeal histone domain-containing protein n=1 Tax=Psophocarpus tetragonolobus TaxID=3891 RepID=A0AAN9X632_PSOTE